MSTALIEAMARALFDARNEWEEMQGELGLPRMDDRAFKVTIAEWSMKASATLSALTSHAAENGGTVHLGDDWMLIRTPEVREPTEADLEKARSLHLSRSIEAVEAAGYVVAEVAQLQALFRECADTFREMGHPEIADRIDAAALLSARPRTTP